MSEEKLEQSEIIDELNKCENFLKQATFLLKTSYKGKNVPQDFISTIEDLKNDLDDQMSRAKKDTYEIAVVGPEKAGKSTLLNAWIDFDLLPTNPKRCTLTTTEIHLCNNPREEGYLIEYFTSEEFD